MNEAATGVKSIVVNVSGVAESAQENSKKSTETKDAANVLTGVASRLAQLVANFKTGDSSDERAADVFQPDDRLAIPDAGLLPAAQESQEGLMQ